MAFEDELGRDSSQPYDSDQDYVLSATGLVSRTIDLWIKKLVSFIIIIGVVSAALLAVSYIVLLTMFGLTEVASSDPINFLFSVYLLAPVTDPLYFTVSLLCTGAIFIVNVILAGAVIKFTLDSYGQDTGDIASSYRHSLGKFVPLLLYQILISALTAIVFVPGLYFTSSAMDQIIIDFNNPLNSVFPPGSIEMFMTGAMILFIGAFFLLFIQARLAPTLAIIVDTDQSVVDSIKQAWNLTSGNLLRILAAQILLIIAIMIFTFSISYGLSYVLGDVPIVYVIESIAVALFFSALNLIFVSILYRDLIARSEKMVTTL